MDFSYNQQKAIDARNTNVIVSASAGSGKTRVLVERLCQLVIKKEASIDHILAMTFTNDAACEMKDRLKQELEKMPMNEYVQNQLTLLETASICTIDSFCQSLLKTYYYKVPISYTMAQTVANEAQSNVAFQNAYTKALNNLDFNQSAKFNAFFQAFNKQEKDIQTYIQRCIDLVNTKPDGNAWYKQVLENYDHFNEQSLDWFYQFFIEKVEAMMDILNSAIDTLDEYGCSQKAYNTSMDLYRAKQKSLEPCIEYLEKKDYASFKLAFITHVQATKNMPGKINKIDVLEKKEYNNHQQEILDVLFDMDTYQQDLQNNSQIISIFIQLCKDTQTYFSLEKEKMNVIDFTDMEHFALKLLDEKMIAEELKEKYDYILVDEFQDTNELQEAIISKFSRINNVFRVGDIKQSIYGFRQANPNIMKGHMAKEDENNTTIVLEENYRSNASIIEFNNDFYQKIMNTKLLGKQFEDIDIAKVGKDQKDVSQYPIRFLYTEIDPWRKENNDINFMIARSLHEQNRYDIIAKDILKQIQEGKKYKDICILLRSRNKQEVLKDCLESYGIPVFGQVSHGFFQNSAVQIVLSCLWAMLQPHDDIHLLASLNSPLFNVSTKLISSSIESEYAYSLYSKIKDKEYMNEFNTFRSHRFDRVVECIKQIYSQNDFYSLHTSSQDKTNLDYLLEKAVNYPYPNDLPGFVEELESESKLDKTGEAAAVGKEENVVRIMTMHASKGLQFPIVYILSQNSTNTRFENEPILFDSDLGIALASVDHKHMKTRNSLYQIAYKTKKMHEDLMEEMRILYVATTRPVEQLIFVDTIKDKKEFNYPLNTRALLNRRSYTSWMFHTYLNEGSVVFKSFHDLEQRGEKPQPINYQQEKKVYTNEVIPFVSQTASASKVKQEWKPFVIANEDGTIRGTLFHEMAQLPYPYKKEDVEEFAYHHGYKMRPIDLEQFLSLNENESYKDCMAHSHQFELSYIVQKNNTVTHGFMDLVVWKKDKVIILDFKTDTVATSKELIDRYHKQLQTYKESYLEIDSSKPIECVLYSFHLKKYIKL